MNIVQPIRDINKIQQIEAILKKESFRDYILFRLGINSGLRISDILKLKVEDLRNQDYFILREQKTNKPQRLKIQPELKKEIDLYIKDKPDSEYLFKSRKGNNKPIQRVQAYRIINKVAKRVGLLKEVGTHTLRKTFGYHFYMQYNDKNNRGLSILQQIFNHSSTYVTLRYIGIVQDEIDDLIDDFNFDYNNKKVV